MNKRLSGTIHHIVIGLLMPCVLAVLTSGCGGPPKSDRSAVLKGLNSDDVIIEKGGKIERITFGSKSNDEWPFEAMVVDNQGQRLGVVKGTVNKGARISLKQNHRMLRLSDGAATWAPVEWK